MSRNISIFRHNLFHLDIKYDVVLFSEVIMQLNNPEEYIKYIVDKNPNVTIITCHTIFSPLVSSVISPIKNNIMQYIPILNIARGRALTFEQTTNIFTSVGCKLEKFIKIYDNKIIFVFKKDFT